jgi:hypothetical protein
MSTWKIKRSRKAGQIPNVNQFPDSQTAIWNQRDGKLWGLQVDHDATRHVVLIGGGINTITDAHDRLHDLDSVLDHAPATGDKKGKWLRTHPDTGAPTLSPITHVSEDEPETAIEGDFWFDLDELASAPGVKIVMATGLSSYIEPSQHGLGANIQVSFFEFDSDLSKLTPINIYYEIDLTGRIYWKSERYLNDGRAIIK